jgi:DNA-binding IclR family transcriptional regulator
VVPAPGLGVSAYVGQWLPVWASALGKTLLATLPPDRTRTMAPKLAAHGSLGLTMYLADVERTRMTGVAVDREEYLPGVRALAASIPAGEPLQPLGAIWAVGLTPSLADARIETVADELRNLADEVGRRVAAGSENRADAGRG